jgi:hypothetical protein
MAVQIPPILVLIVCKTISAGGPDENARFTGYKDLEWATEHSMMVCRRHEVQLFDPAEGVPDPKGKPTPPLNPNLAANGQCARAGMQMATDWDMHHRNSKWRVWRVGCPAPIVDTRTGALIGYKLPECGHRETVICEVDSAI